MGTAGEYCEVFGKEPELILVFTLAGTTAGIATADTTAITNEITKSLDEETKKGFC